MTMLSQTNNKELSMFGLGVIELVIIFAVILLFFGSKKLPQLGRSLGLMAKEFNKAKNDDSIDVTETSKEAEKLSDQNKNV